MSIHHKPAPMTGGPETLRVVYFATETKAGCCLSGDRATLVLALGNEHPDPPLRLELHLTRDTLEAIVGAIQAAGILS